MSTRNCSSTYLPARHEKVVEDPYSTSAGDCLNKQSGFIKSVYSSLAVKYVDMLPVTSVLMKAMLTKLGRESRAEAHVSVALNRAVSISTPQLPVDLYDFVELRIAFVGASFALMLSF